MQSRECRPLIIGVDEAGRGPLAGPVVAAAVCLGTSKITGLGDSKKLSEKRRAILEPLIREQCMFGIGIASVDEIDSVNIFQATMIAMTRAVLALCEKVGQEPQNILIDGNKVPLGRVPEWRWQSCEAIVKGDAKEPCISAASILAKELRDRMMKELCAAHPAYGFSKHKGYGTAEHLAALRQYGPTIHHRKSFAPVAQLALL